VVQLDLRVSSWERNGKGQRKKNGKEKEGRKEKVEKLAPMAAARDDLAAELMTSVLVTSDSANQTNHRQRHTL